MYPANDNANEKVIPFNFREWVLSSPATLLANDLHSDLYNLLHDEGYDPDDTEMFRDLAVVGEMIRAMLLRQHGEEHRYQKFFDKVRIAHDPTIS